MLFRRLVNSFEAVDPLCEEAPLPDELPRARAGRLAVLKATSIRDQLENCLIIGSDQVAECRGRILHKPGTSDQAVTDLLWSAGHRIDFWTAVCVLDTRTGKVRSAIDHTRVWMRECTQAEIQRYLTKDQPWSSAASFRAESLGPALFRSMATRDSTALIGLPLVALCRLLREAGYPLP
ncbi:septum formation protein Maf [mine drainage metagenome]|uniref:Septum formation protein Maf n=1 Tax=mine drainage metagenome TaxID=410659 RepID=T1D3T1_9ZZZZ